MVTDALDRITRLEVKLEANMTLAEKIERRLHAIERNVWAGIGILGALQFVAAWVVTRL